MGTEIGLFDLAEKRLAWVDQRQQLLAQNIANANTPGYQSKDLTPFAQALAQTAPGLVRTSAMHLAGPDNGTPLDRKQRPNERAIDGNAVSVEEQLVKVAGTAGTHALVTNLYRKYMGMFHNVIGK
jgi:flagellar basal-body rod protein FlgB